MYGTHPGWMHDLSRRIPESPAGVMEAINKAAIDTFSAEGVQWLHFGFTPFTSPRRTGSARPQPAFHWFMHYLWEHAGRSTPRRTQLAYKDKWDPDLVTAEYVGVPRARRAPRDS